MGTVCAAGWQLLTGQGRVNSFCGLIANFHSPKTKKIPAGRLALGDCLGCCWVLTEVGIFVSLGVKKLVSDDQSDCRGTSYKGAQSASEVSWFWAPLLWPWAQDSAEPYSFHGSDFRTREKVWEERKCRTMCRWSWEVQWLAVVVSGMLLRWEKPDCFGLSVGWPQ